MLEKSLLQLGLNKNEIQAYLALLPIGTAPASTLGKRLNIPRSTAKYTCDHLAEKGLVSETNKNSTTFYTAKDPASLQFLLDKDKRVLADKQANLDRAIGELKMMFNTKLSLPKVQFFEGAESMMKLMRDVLDDQQPLYGALNFAGMDPAINDFVREIYIPERMRLGFPAHMIFNDNEATKEYQKLDQKMNRVSLLVPEKLYPFEICFQIYGDKIAFYSYKSTDLVGILIEDTYIRRSQFSLFKMAWDFARRLKVNADYRDVSLSKTT